jgi:hypothetical protein
MKHISFIISTIILSFANIKAQNPTYLNAMEGLVNEIQNAKFGSPLQPLANKMERIANTEKTEWLPNYWVAYCYLMDSYSEKDDDKKDQLLDKADTYLEKIDKLVKGNDEVEIMRANIANARIAVSPSFRWMKYGSKIDKALNVAKKLKPQNPRISLLEAQGIFYTPAMFGGGKVKSKPVLEKAIEQFSKFKPTSCIHPNWGEMTAKWMLSQTDK